MEMRVIFIKEGINRRGIGGGQIQDSPGVAVRVEGSGCTQEKLDQMWGCGRKKGKHAA